MFKRILLLWLAFSVCAVGQQTQPQVKVNVINVCAPSPEEKQEMASALARVPKQPLFSPDFEVARGRSTLTDNPGFLQPGQGAQMSSDTTTASWVRIRREFSVQALFSTAQYSFSTDGKTMTEVLVLRVRDPKDLLLLSIEDSASAVTTAATMLATSTPASHIKLERLGKSSVVLARCQGSEGNPPPDQSAYESLFQSASSIMSNYRGLLDARTTVPVELERIGNSGTVRPKSSKHVKK